MKKLFLKMSIMLLSVGALFTSCVQGDLYEDELSMEFQVPRNKRSKENTISPDQCGICCMAYLKYGNVSDQSTRKIVGFADELNISIEDPLTSSNIARICNENGIGSITTWVGVSYIVDGERQTIRDYLIQQLNTGKTPVIIQKEPNHWVIGTSINTNSQVVNYYDPKYCDYYGNNLSGTIGFDQIDCLIY